jgi:hypothetical protein
MILSSHPDYSWLLKQKYYPIISKLYWTPTLRISRIIDEVDKIGKFKRALVYSVFVDKIKEKYRVPEDIPLLDYLV